MLALLQSLLTGLMYYRPDDPVEYMESCLKKVRDLGGTEKVRWDTFVSQEKKSLAPLNGGQSRRSFFRNVLPDSSNFPYRRYDRLPPIHQFSIESDSDLSETAELIEEYEVFDPMRPRPKIILVIGGPGSGKGTQSLKIAERYGFEYISVGELLRNKMFHNATSNRKWSLIAKIITNGELAPQICTPDLVVFLACVNNRLKERLERRAEQQGRPDDNPKATERRLANFKQNTIPLVKYFQEKGLIVTLDADRDEEEVFYDISVTVDNKLFPTKEPVAGPSELDLSLLVDSADMGSDFEEQEILLELVKEAMAANLDGTKGFLIDGFPRDVRQGEEFELKEILLELVKEAMAANLDGTKGFLIDGFPRDVRQGEEFELKIAEPSLVLFMDCSTETMTKRLQRRDQASPGNDSCRDTIRKRVDTFRQTTGTVVTHYESRRLSHTPVLSCLKDGISNTTRLLCQLSIPRFPWIQPVETNMLLIIVTSRDVKTERNQISIPMAMYLDPHYDIL
ncbi:UNVERIFIED_CONTAM: hypothetical protein FKN15_032382 [Acipenser sinensis]